MSLAWGSRDQAPWEARAATFPAVVRALGQCMGLRFTAIDSNLWRVAVRAFTAVVSAGLPAVNIAAVNGEEPPPPDCWSALAEAFEGLLLAAHLEGEDINSARPQGRGLLLCFLLNFNACQGKHTKMFQKR